MNTPTRRFLLRLIIGLLTFMLGVAAAMLLGGFRPFQAFAGSPYYRTNRSYYHSMSPEPAYSYPVYREYGHGCRMHERFNDVTPSAPAPKMDSPLPADPPRAIR
ncbi:MAG: hypothetical protein DMF68_09860 [Acidobacteria bacterium]|nr:MAG: hypothetical protein DMF68_09860 [Acidobacteriota bacterium]